MKKVKNIYYATTKEELEELGDYSTGLVIELEDGRMFRGLSESALVAFTEFKPSVD